MDTGVNTQQAATPIEEPKAEEGENGTSRFLDRNAILSLKFEPKIERVEVPEWGGHLFVRELSGTQRDAFELSTLQTRGNNREANLSNLRARLVAWCACGETGKRIFTDSDVEELGRKSAKALTRVYNIAQELSSLTESDVEVLTKSLGEDQSDDSGSN